MASLTVLVLAHSVGYAAPLDGGDERGDKHHPQTGAAQSPALSFRDAVALALERSPELRVYTAEVRAREALTLQAGLRPNPELRTEVENVGGSGSRKGFEDTESTFLLSQLIELGGKRSRRQEAAALSERLATWDYEAKRLSALTTTAKAFIAALAAQERLALALELERLGRESLGAVQRSVTAGASAPVETTRARVTLGRTTLERTRAERELVAARSVLAASWGEREPEFVRLAGNLTAVRPPPPKTTVLSSLEHNPDLARWKTEQEERAAALALEEAEAYPNVNVAAGGRHFSDNGDNAFVFELNVPLPLFNRNQGAIAAARHRLTKARDEQSAVEAELYGDLAEAYERLRIAYEQASAIASELLPDARASYTGTLDAFRQGLLRPVDVLEAQRTLFELRGEYLRTLESFHLAAADVERLTGGSLGELSGGPQ